MPIRADSTPQPVPDQPQGLPPAALWRPDAWRLHLYRLNGDGTQTMLAPDVPISDPEVTTTLSGTDTIRGTFTPEVARLVDQVVPWSSAVLAEFNGAILAMCIVDDVTDDGPAQQFSAQGFFGYLSGMPYDGDYSGVQVDPLDVARLMWDHVQGKPDGNLGLVLDATTSKVKIGTDPKDKDFTTGSGEDVSFESGPYTLGWWKTDDLAEDFTELATSTPFDFAERHAWNGPGSGDIEHRLMLGYPALGRRRHDLRFAVGENIRVLPTVQVPGDEYASEVLMLGSGEGKKMLRAHAPGTTKGRLRRVAVVDDKSLDSQRKVDAAAAAEAAWRTGDEDVATVVVADHPNAPLASWASGDEIHLVGDGLPWAGDLDLWVRVLSTTYARDAGTATLTVTRAERTTRG